jgi:hypothetical protein
MGHNKDRRPTYPAENKKGKGKSFVKLLKDGWAFALLVIYFVFLIIYSIVTIHDNHIRRNQIKDNPVETEAVITRIGKKEYWRGRHSGTPVYYDYYVGDSLYHGMIYERKVNNMKVGHTIKITYEKDNPSNSMFGETLSQY